MRLVSARRLAMLISLQGIMGGQVADSTHIEILRRGPRAWNAWRRDNPSHIPNLDDAALSLSERQLGPINGGPINLRSATIQRASFRAATLSAGAPGAAATSAHPTAAP